MSSIEKCYNIEFKKIKDNRGNLTYIENNSDIPFKIKRVYYLYDIPAGAKRGGHAHKELHQVIIPIHGSFDMLIYDGNLTDNIFLNKPHVGFYLCPLIWRELLNFSGGAVCMVLASEKYTEEDYIYDKTTLSGQ